MKLTSFLKSMDSVWYEASQEKLKPKQLLFLCFWGFAVGAAAGAVVSAFRIITSASYQLLLNFTSAADPVSGSAAFIFALSIAFALITGFLMRDPAIRFGGVSWELYAIADGQPHPWRKILIPKFIGTMLVMDMGISVGHAEPCVQMGAAAALGMGQGGSGAVIKRRFFILGGCSAGLSAAFSAPFTGIAYVYEVMKLKMDSVIFVFLLSGSLGVWITESQLFGLGMILPFGAVSLPNLGGGLWLLPLGALSGLAGYAYTRVLRGSKKIYQRQKLLPPCLRPLIVFPAAAALLCVFPALTGNGFSIFQSIQSGQALAGWLCLFALAKLFFTAFCYGSGIPAGVMMPLLCIGGACGGIYGLCLASLGAIPPDLVGAMTIMGMAATFACAEQAPVTAMFLVLELTGAWGAAPWMLLPVAAAVFCGRLLKIQAV